jgi:hypothetical protein
MTATPRRDWLVNRLPLYKLGTDLLENITSISFVSYVFVAADTCLWSCCLAMTISSDSTIPPFRCPVTTWIRFKIICVLDQGLSRAGTIVTCIQQLFACWRAPFVEKLLSFEMNFLLQTCWLHLPGFRGSVLHWRNLSHLFLQKQTTVHPLKMAPEGRNM